MYVCMCVPRTPHRTAIMPFKWELAFIDWALPLMRRVGWAWRSAAIRGQLGHDGEDADDDDDCE